jgi:hypothetical protein
MKKIIQDIDLQKLRLTFFVVALFANITEGYITGLSQLWFIFLLMAMASSGTNGVFAKRR